MRSHRSAVILAAAAALVSGARAAEVTMAFGKQAHEDSCSIGAPASSFSTNDASVFVRVVAAGHRFRIEWLDPAEQVESEAVYENLPPGPVCLINQLPVAGLGPASKPGTWTVQVSVDGRGVARKAFQIGATAAAGPRVESVQANGGQLELRGSGFRAGDVVHVARLNGSGQWEYIAAGLSDSVAQSILTTNVSVLPPGEYIAVVRDSSGGTSAPSRFTVSTRGGYQRPAGESWVITQGPNGTFSHWNRSSNAWDIAPRQDRTVFAMRGGIVHTHDLRLGQTPRWRSFGNYISIDHGDGEYSHYAHLATGTFLVRDGQRVEAGQPLARAGNSGYTLGSGGGVHLHAHVTRSPSISAQSVPFRFGQATAAVAARSSGGGRTASVQVAQWWTDLTPVRRGTRQLDVRIEWDNTESELELHLVSPSGRHYGWYGDQSGYSGAHTRPQEFKVPRPEPGTWRISVQGIRGSDGPIDFRIAVAGSG